MALQAFSNADVTAEAAAPPKQPRVQSKLAEWAGGLWRAAVDHRDEEGITERFMQCRRQVRGEYESDVVAKIKAQNGSSAYFNITATKTSAAEGWLRSTAMPVNEKSWTVKHTPIPSLPASVQERAVEAVVARFQIGDLEPTDEEVTQFTGQMLREIERMYDEEAKAKALKAEEVMADQMEEGGFYDALVEFIQFYTQYPIAWLKGPTMRAQRRIKWGARNAFGVEDALVPQWSAPNPMDMYPGPNARSAQDTYLCERIRFTKSALAHMRGLDGWSTPVIDWLLQANPEADVTALEAEDERATQEERDVSKNAGITGDELEGVEIWGAVQGQMLIDWGGAAPWLGAARKDPLGYHEVCVVLIGGRVAKAVLNPDPLGQRPYSVSSFFPRPGSLVGMALPESMRDCQQTVNAAARDIQNNAALSSGPFQMVDLDALEPGQKPEQHRPWRIYQYRGSKTQGGKVPISFHDIPINVAELLTILEYWAEQADDRTLIPRFVHGNEDVGGATNTATGAKLVQGNAAKGIMLVIARMDKDIMVPTLTRLYNWNMQYGDEAIRGDAQIVPRGLLASIMKEETALRQKEFLATTLNDTDMQIIRPEGRAEVLRAIAGSLDIPIDKVIPPAEELAERLQAEREAAAAQPQQPEPQEQGARR